VTRYSTRSLQITRNSLERAIRHAEANDLVGRNVAALVKPPRGRRGRPSKSFTLDQAKALLAAAEGTRLHACVALSLLVGIRTEEARERRTSHKADGGCWHALPMGIDATLMLAPGCSPWRPKSETTTSPDAATDGDGGEDPGGVDPRQTGRFEQGRGRSGTRLSMIPGPAHAGWI
jgi:hypothetical protein